ncbi:hypothetical protein [Anabaena sp. UHCC 0187]|uniref:hypothetical protein n=1 Tax=Anabaena sp. UHCC 0187 TaxID=2590018 RepID=UPI001445841D|nr:hypothetical protein [Anabaena sp. UHCC 0187]
MYYVKHNIYIAISQKINQRSLVEEKYIGAISDSRFSVAEYLEAESKSKLRHEYLG